MTKEIVSRVADAGFVRWSPCRKATGHRVHTWVRTSLAAIIGGSFLEGVCDLPPMDKCVSSLCPCPRSLCHSADKTRDVGGHLTCDILRSTFQNQERKTRSISVMEPNRHGRRRRHGRTRARRRREAHDEPIITSNENLQMRVDRGEAQGRPQRRGTTCPSQGTRTEQWPKREDTRSGRPREAVLHWCRDASPCADPPGTRQGEDPRAPGRKHHRSRVFSEHHRREEDGSGGQREHCALFRDTTLSSDQHGGRQGEDLRAPRR